MEYFLLRCYIVLPIKIGNIIYYIINLLHITFYAKMFSVAPSSVSFYLFY